MLSPASPLQNKNNPGVLDGYPKNSESQAAKCSLALLYKENHALDAWFNKAYGDK